jgi:hypothetical protein
MRLGNRLRAAAQVLAIFFGGAAQANIVTNPGFETGDFTGWTLSGDTSFTFIDSFFPRSGSFSAFLGTSDFDPAVTGSITQALATTAGASYEIEFWLNTEFTPNFFSVSFDGIVLDSLTDITTITDGGCSHPSPIAGGCYTLFSYTALASSASTDLVFTFQNDPWGWDLDDVSVEAATAVPESGSLLLVAVGLIALLAVRTGQR